MTTQTLPVVDEVVVTVVARKPCYVCAFEIGDLVETHRPLVPFCGTGNLIPRYSVGTITRVTANTCRVSFLFWGVRWLDKDDLAFALSGIPAPIRLAEYKEGDATR